MPEPKLKMEMLVMPTEEMNLFNTAQDLIDFVWPKSKELILLDGYHIPTIFVVKTDSLNIIDASSMLGSNRGKNALGEMLRDIAKEDDVMSIGFVAEGWTLKGLKKENEVDEVYKEYGSLSEHPDRVEMLHLTVEMRNKTSKMCFVELERDEDGNIIKLTNEICDDVSELGGRLTGVFPAVH